MIMEGLNMMRKYTNKPAQGGEEETNEDGS